MNAIFDAWTPRVLAVLRIVAALLFMEHGLMKLFGFPAPMGAGGSLPPLLQFAGWLETLGSPLLVIGLFTRPVAILLSGEMAVAYFMAHAPNSFWPVLNHGEPAVLYCFVFLFLAFAGPGAFSLDAKLWSNRAGAPVSRAV